MDNAERFTGRVGEYERYRMRYPVEHVLGVLREWCGLTSHWRVADIGAGTGMLAEVFLENGNCVTAVEPNAEMRAACERLIERYPALRVVNATAETTTLAEASVEMVAAGRAFHWFDPERSIAEFRRILRPDGWVALVAVGRSKEGTEQSRAYEALLTEHGTDYAYVREGYRVHERMEELFGGVPVLNRELRSETRLTLEQFIGQATSTSTAPLRGHPKYEGMQRALHSFFARYAVDDVLVMQTSCWMTCAQLGAV